MNTRGIVALIVALTILGTMWGAVGLYYSHPDMAGKSSPESWKFWRDILLVLIGALSGYIGGSDE